MKEELNTDETTLGDCIYCNGLGYLTVDDTVWVNEPHKADVGGKVKCVCQMDDSEHINDE